MVEYNAYILSPFQKPSYCKMQYFLQFIKNTWKGSNADIIEEVTFDQAGNDTCF